MSDSEPARRVPSLSIRSSPVPQKPGRPSAVREPGLEGALQKEAAGTWPPCAFRPPPPGVPISICFSQASRPPAPRRDFAVPAD